MKVDIRIDPACGEPAVTITAPALTDEIKALAELPSKEVLQAQVLGTMLAPITSLAIVLKAIAEEKGGFVEAAAEPEAAPAE